MALLSRNDLQYHYNWKEYDSNDPKVSGDIDNTSFNRAQGNEVLFLINKIAEKHNITNRSIGLRIEIMINEDLPGEIQTQEEVRLWIKSNW